LTLLQWAVAFVSASVIGISKTGIPGSGILAIPAMALILPARQSVGVVLPMLIFADLFAIAAYRRHARWSALVRLFPWAAVGVVIGFLCMGRVNDRQLQPVLGAIILAMLALQRWLSSSPERQRIPGRWWFAGLIGLLAGTTTMLANAAGPVMMVYLLAMRLPKSEFLGTGAWYFFLMNWFKVPFSAHLGLITPSSLLLDAVLVPGIAAGALLGIPVARRIPQKAFTAAVELLSAAAAVRLIAG